MDNFINFLMGDSLSFTPEFLIRFFVFLCVLEMIVSICKTIMSVAK